MPTPASYQGTRAVGRGDLVTAAVALSVAVGSLLALPAVATLEASTSTSAEVPALGSAAWWSALIALLPLAAAVMWARSRPIAALTGAGAVVLVSSLAESGQTVGLKNLLLVVVVYRAAVAHPVARLWAPLTMLAVLTGIGAAAAGANSDLPSTALAWLVDVGGGVAVVAVGLVPAMVVSSRRALRDARDGELRALVREQEAVLRSAVATERTAMAREVHDIAAHHLSGIALMASAIDRQMDTDPAAAHQGLREVRDQSRVVLNDLRRLVGLLRDGGAPEASGPLSLAAIPGLFDAGGTASFRLTPAADGRALGAGLGPVAQLTAYRMVQESLANARHHAPGAACVVTLDDSRADSVLLTVRNEAPTAEPAGSSSGGHGLLGMRERAALVGATLRHGPTVDGGWEVRLTIPRDPDHTAQGGFA